MDGIATAFQRRFHISVDESEQNNVSVCPVDLSFFLLFFLAEIECVDGEGRKGN
jgi:hypothetical protein